MKLLAHLLQRAIFGAVVNDDHFELRIIQHQEISNGNAYGAFFVVRRSNDGDRRCQRRVRNPFQAMAL
jgi:hypothetical protein